MNCLSESFPVQMAATACLYNLTKSDLASKIHTSVLAKVVEATLDAMERFPNHNQLQKNTLLTLCSDRILQVCFFIYTFVKLFQNNWNKSSLVYHTLFFLSYAVFDAKKNCAIRIALSNLIPKL